MSLRVNLGVNSYDIVIERGCLKKAGDHLSLQRKVLIVRDSGVPLQYAQALASACKEPVICTIGQGEEHKTLQSYEMLLARMLSCGFTRKDCVAAVGGGICGDLAGFAAASYMRGIDFYNIPTTVLSQVDSSIGGKTAVNLNGIKNAVGAFYQPRKVLIDADVLKTLPRRQVSAGLAEALKMAVTFDEDLFRLFEEGDVDGNIEKIIEGSGKPLISVTPSGTGSKARLWTVRFSTENAWRSECCPCAARTSGTACFPSMKKCTCPPPVIWIWKQSADQ